MMLTFVLEVGPRTTFLQKVAFQMGMVASVSFEAPSSYCPIAGFEVEEGRLVVRYTSWMMLGLMTSMTLISD